MSIVPESYLVGHLQEALEAGWIELYLQPIVHTLTERVLAFELSTRWQDPHYGLILQETYLPALERARTIPALDLWLVRTLTEKMRDLRDQGQRLVPVSVSFSAVDFEEMDLFAYVEEMMGEAGLSLELLIAGIRESTLSQLDDIDYILRRFRTAGVEVWVDDFGNGSSSFHTLKDHEFDGMKIDFSLPGLEGGRARSIIQSLVQMAKAVDICPIAKGVETEEQFSFLKEIGVWNIEGPYYGQPLPFEKMLEHLSHNALSLGDMEEIHADRRLSSLDLLSVFPDKDLGRDRTSLRPGKPLAICVYHGSSGNTAEKIEIRYENEEMRKTLEGIGTKLDQILEKLNEGEGVRFLRMLLERGSSRFWHDFQGKSCRIEGSLLSAMEDSSVILLTVTPPSGFGELGSLQEQTLRQLTGLFDSICLVDTGKMTTTLIFGKEAFAADPTQRNIGVIPLEQVHPSDRASFRAFTDFRTLEERFALAGSSYIQTQVRIKDGNGNVSIHHLVMMRTGEKTFLMISSRNHQSPVLRKPGMIGLDATETKSPEVSAGGFSGSLSDCLWDAFIKDSQFGIFWKDCDRRFLGCNQYFLDYYGFSSWQEILGKTDEEMGWHVSPDKYKDDEWRVIHDGIVTVNVPGSCIARGENRNIIASKMPVRDADGSIIGLMGFFRDTMNPTLTPEEKSYMDRLSRVDGLTGLQNAFGYQLDYLGYEDEYRRRGTDFAVILIGIADFSTVTKNYGRLYGDHMIHFMAGSIVEICGKSASVARLSGTSFVVLKQVEDKAGALEIIRSIQGRITHDPVISGIPCEICMRAGFALCSEAEDQRQVEELARNRMDNQKA